MAVDGSSLLLAAQNALIRARENGSLDLDFTATVDRVTNSAQITVIKKDSQGRILIGGDFIRVQALPRPGVARLLSNGQLDQAFLSAPTPPLTNTIVRSIALQSDGKILVAAYAVTTNTPQGFIVRLTPDGTLDATFSSLTTADNAIDALAIQPDGGILVGGRFTNFAGQSRNQLCRLLSNGSLDDSFNPARLMPLVSGITILEDQRILAYWSGGLIPYDADLSGTPTNALVRFHNDGSTDTILRVGAKFVSDVAVQPDGKYILGGRFLSIDQLYGYYKRILPTGETDTTFRPIIGHGNIFYENGADAFVQLDSQNRLIIGGPFTYVNGVPRQIARLLNDTNPCVPILTFPTNRFEFVETNGVVSLPIFRTGDIDSTVSVDIASSYLSIPPFQPIKTNIVFNPGVAQQNLLIPLTNDTAIQIRQTFQIYLTNQSPNSVLGPNRIAQVSILDESSQSFPGSIDPAFYVSFGYRPYPYGAAMVIMPDKKIVAAENFNFVNGIQTPPLVRINPDGSLDSTFNFTSTNIPAILVPSGNNLYVATRDVPRSIIRLLPNGAEDPTFTPPNLGATRSSTSESVIRALSVRSDGGVLIAGSFTNVNGILRDGLARLKADGSLDESFEGAAGSGHFSYKYSNVIFTLPDGSYLLGGPASVHEGEYYPLLTHLSSTGSILPDFQIPDVPLDRDWNAWSITSIARQSDGSIVLGGYLSATDSMTERHLLRFTPSRNLDPSFNPSNEVYASQVFVQADDKIIATAGGAVRLNKDGSLDPSFIFSEWAYSPVIFAMDAAENLYMRGNFRNYAQFAMPGILRIRCGSYSGPGIVELDAPEEVYENAGSVTLTIRRTLSTQGEARVRVRTRDSSPPPGDNYIPVDTLVIFADGEGGEKHVQVPLIDNPTPHPWYTGFQAYLTAESPGLAIAGFGAVRSVLIYDNESGFYLDSGLWAYEDNGSAYVAVRRTGDLSSSASVELVIGSGGNAVPGVDYQPGIQTVEFAAHEDSKSVLIPLINDDVAEPDKTLEVKLQNPSAGNVIDEVSTVSIAILDNADEFDFVHDTLYAVQENRVARLLIQPLPLYSGKPTKNVTLAYKTEGGSAQAGVEYIPQQGEITFTATYSQPKEILIPLLPNSIVGPPTTIRVTITSLTPEIKITNQTATIILQHPPAVYSPGAADPSFKLNVPYPRRIDSFVEVGNYIYTWEYSIEPWFSPSRLARYFRDGSPDESFNPAFLGEPYGGYGLVALSNNQILVTGYTTSGTAFRRLNSDGSLDQSFHPVLPPLSWNFQTLPEPNGKLIVAGFVQIAGESPTAFVRRLNYDGSLDFSFATFQFEYPSNFPFTLARQPDGRIILVGGFSELDGLSRKYLARLMPNGQIDKSFIPPENTQYPGSVTVGGDGTIYLSAWFTNDNQQSLIGVARLNDNGSIHDWIAMQQNANDYLSLIIDTQNRLYLSRPNSLNRIFADGQPDPSFIAAFSGNPILVGRDSLIAITPQDGSIHRLYLDPPNALRAPELLPNNRIVHTFNFPANASYILEQTEDFIIWTPLTSGLTTDGYVRFESDAPNSPRFYRVRAQ
jgi:uncharacterized delta-60 repeat protein